MPLTKRELFLQNRLAMASVLLFRCTRFLLKLNLPQSESFLIECEIFFSETREQISSFVDEPPLSPSPPPPSAPPVWKKPPSFAERIRSSFTPNRD